MARMLWGLLLLFLVPQVFSALSGAGYLATTFVTQTTDGTYGPIGLIFQRDGTFWSHNIIDGYVYHYSATGTLLSKAAQALGGGPRGMVFSKTERLYICILPNRLIEWDTTTNAFRRDVTTFDCLGMVVDPVSGDIFATDLYNGDKIWRLSNYESGTPAVSLYYQANAGSFFDGIAVTPSGRFYAAWYSTTNGGVYTITGVNDANPGVGTRLATVPTLDGISVGVNLFDVEYPPYVIANNNDGTLKQVDLTANPATVNAILSGGTRGDFSVVGYDGCIYATQTDRVVKISFDNGQCMDLYPTCPNKVPTLTFIPNGYENVTVNTNWCVQLQMQDNPESLSWSCSVDWGDFTPAQSCSITQNPQTITLCHTFTQYFAGYLPITVTVTDDQRFPAGARKFIQLVRAPPPPTTTAASATAASATVTGATATGATATGPTATATGPTATASQTTVSGINSGNTNSGNTNSGNTNSQTGTVSSPAVPSVATSMVYLLLICAAIALLLLQ